METIDDYYENSEHLTIGQPTVKECAARMCISPNYLGDLIRQETEESAIRFINRYIVGKAKSLLVEGNSIASAAYALGFNYPAHLTRLFSRIEGITPTDFLKNLKKD